MYKRVAAVVFGMLAVGWGPCERSIVGAQAAPPKCGGNATEHIIPAEGLVCSNTAVLADGQSWTVVVYASADGTGLIEYSTSVHAEAVEVFATPHIDVSGNDPRTPFSTVLDPGQTSVSLPYTMPGDCRGQLDIKAINNNRDTPTNRVKIAAPLLVAPNCGSVITVPTVPPDTAVVIPPETTLQPPTTVPEHLPPTGTGLAILSVAFFLLISGILFLVFRSKKADTNPEPLE